MADNPEAQRGTARRSLGVYLGVAMMLFVVLLVYAAGQLLVAVGAR
jgi:hypothetical protein